MKSMSCDNKKTHGHVEGNNVAPFHDASGKIGISKPDGRYRMKLWELWQHYITLTQIV